MAKNQNADIDIPSTVAMALMVFVFVGIIVIGGMTTLAENEGMQQYADNAEQWCNAEGGELYNAMSVAHGGLHCDIPGGPNVHMWEVKDLGWTHDMGIIKATAGATSQNTPFLQGLFGDNWKEVIAGSALITLTIAIGMGIGARFKND